MTELARNVEVDTRLIPSLVVATRPHGNRYLRDRFLLVITIVRFGVDTQKRSLVGEVHGRHLLQMFVVPREAACLNRLALVTLHSAAGTLRKNNVPHFSEARAHTVLAH